MPTPETRPDLITSRNHPLMRHVRSLQARSVRDSTGRFFVEGIRFIAQAVERRAYIDRLLVAPELLRGSFATQLWRRLRRAGIPCTEVSRDVFHSVAANDDPQGLGAVIRQDWEELPEAKADDDLWVAVATVQSAGNLGSMLRTCDAVGCAGVIFLGDGPDPYDPATVRATMGALFSQRLVRATFSQFMSWKLRTGRLLVGTSPSAEREYQGVWYPSSLVLFMGGERKGLAEEEQAACDHMVRIPMRGRGDSLNLSVATAVVLYEVLGQRRGHPERVRLVPPGTGCDSLQTG